MKTTSEAQCIYSIVMACTGYLCWKLKLEEMPNGENYICLKYLYMPGVHGRYEILLGSGKANCKLYILALSL